MAPPAETAIRPQATRLTNRPPPALPRITPAIPLAFSKPYTSKQPTASSRGESASAGTPEQLAPQEGTNEFSNMAKEEGFSKGNAGNQVASSSVHIAESLTKELVADETRPTNNTSSKASDAQQSALGNLHKQPQASPKPQVTAPVPHRIIPRELPPPFYPPSEQRSTPTSATSSSFAPPSFHQRVPQMAHQARPSANGLVFGGYPDSSSTSPAPHSGGYMGYAPNGPLGPLGPPNYAMGQVGPFPLGHSHHGSETHLPNMFRPLSQLHGPTPIPGPWYPASLGYPPIPPNQMSHQTGIHLDGGTPVSRSPSQSSSHAQETVRRPSFYESAGPGLVPLNHQSTPPYENGAPVFVPQQRLPFVPEPTVISDWLANQFESSEFSDFNLKISHDNGVTTIPIHAVLAARSPCLYDLITASRKAPPSESSAVPVLKLAAAEPFVDEMAVKQVLRNLYSGYLPNIQKVAAGLPPFEANGFDYSPVATDRIKSAVGYASFGALLGLLVVENHGLETIQALLRLDTVGVPLSAALTDRRNTSPAVDTFRRRLLDMLTHFLISNFPRNFAMDSNALPLPALPRLPSTAAHRPSTSSARLSRIQFGEISNQPSDAVLGLYSSILLSLPFVVLHDLLGHPALAQWIGSANMTSIMSSVIAEREAQRKKVKESGKTFLSDDDSPQWREVHWEEQVLHTGPTSATLSRKWTLEDQSPQ